MPAPIDLTFSFGLHNSIQFDLTGFTFPFLLLFLLPMFQNSKTRLEDGGHHIAHIQLLTLPQFLNLSRLVASRSFVWLGSSTDPSFTNREFSNDFY